MTDQPQHTDQACRHDLLTEDCYGDLVCGRCGWHPHFHCARCGVHLETHGPIMDCYPDLAADADAEDVAAKIPVGTIEEAEFWINVLHRRSCSDIKHVNDFYARTSWLAQPWWKRAFRKPPWLRH